MLAAESHNPSPNILIESLTASLVGLTISSVRGVLERVGGREFRKFEINEDENENFPAQNQVPFSCQNLGEDQKKVFTEI